MLIGIIEYNPGLVVRMKMARFAKLCMLMLCGTNLVLIPQINNRRDRLFVAERSFVRVQRPLQLSHQDEHALHGPDKCQQ